MVLVSTMDRRFRDGFHQLDGQLWQEDAEGAAGECAAQRGGTGTADRAFTDGDGRADATDGRGGDYSRVRRGGGPGGSGAGGDGVYQDELRGAELSPGAGFHSDAGRGARVSPPDRRGRSAAEGDDDEHGGPRGTDRGTASLRDAGDKPGVVVSGGTQKAERDGEAGDGDAAAVEATIVVVWKREVTGCARTVRNWHPRQCASPR